VDKSSHPDNDFFGEVMKTSGKQHSNVVPFPSNRIQDRTIVRRFGFWGASTPNEVVEILETPRTMPTIQPAQQAQPITGTSKLPEAA